MKMSRRQRYALSLARQTFGGKPVGDKAVSAAEDTWANDLRDLSGQVADVAKRVSQLADKYGDQPDAVKMFTKLAAIVRTLREEIHAYR